MGTPNSVIQPLQKIQNFAARLVLLAPCHQHSTLLEKLQWLPISERTKYKVTCMCFSAINGADPAYLSELLQVYTPSRTLHSSSNTRMLKIQQYKQRLVAFTPSLALDPTFGIHYKIDTAQPPTSFKARLKTFLLLHAFCPN